MSDLSDYKKYVSDPQIRELAAAVDAAYREIKRLHDSERKALGEASTLARENERLREPFRNVDHLDWSHLESFIPDSGHGRFWKAVFRELKDALADEQSAPSNSVIPCAAGIRCNWPACPSDCMGRPGRMSEL